MLMCVSVSVDRRKLICDGVLDLLQVFILDPKCAHEDVRFRVCRSAEINLLRSAVSPSGFHVGTKLKTWRRYNTPSQINFRRSTDTETHIIMCTLRIQNENLEEIQHSVAD